MIGVDNPHQSPRAAIEGTGPTPGRPLHYTIASITCVLNGTFVLACLAHGIWRVALFSRPEEWLGLVSWGGVRLLIFLQVVPTLFLAGASFWRRRGRRGLIFVGLGIGFVCLAFSRLLPP